MMNLFTNQSIAEQTHDQQFQTRILTKTFTIFGVSLLVVCGLGYLISYLMTSNPDIIGKVSTTYLIGSFLVLLPFSFLRFWIIRKFSTFVVGIFYSLCVVIMAITFSFLFLYFQGQVGNLMYIFGLAGFIFLGSALYGYFTKHNVMRLAPILMFSSIALIVAMVISYFVYNSTLMMAISVFGILIQIGFIIFELYQLKNSKIFIEQLTNGDQTKMQSMENKFAISQAFCLLISFINLVTFLARFMRR